MLTDRWHDLISFFKSASQCSCKLFSLHKFLEPVGMILRKFDFNESKLSRLSVSGLSSPRVPIITQNNLCKVCKMQGNWELECSISPCLSHQSKRKTWCFIQCSVLPPWEHKNFSRDLKQTTKKNPETPCCHLNATKGSYETDSNWKSSQRHSNEEWDLAPSLCSILLMFVEHFSLCFDKLDAVE